MSALKSELCNAIVNGDALLEGVADVAFDAIIGRLARSDVDVANHTALRDAVQSTAAGASKTIRVTEDITWPSLGSAEYPNFTITVPAGANVTLFGAGGVFRRQKIKLSGPSNSTNQPQYFSAFEVAAQGTQRGKLTLRNFLLTGFSLVSSADRAVLVARSGVTTNPKANFNGAAIKVNSGADLDCSKTDFVGNYILLPGQGLLKDATTGTALPNSQQVAITGFGAAVSFVGDNTCSEAAVPSTIVGPTAECATTPSSGCFTCCSFQENYVIANLPVPASQRFTNFQEAVAVICPTICAGGAVHAKQYRNISFRETLFVGNGVQGSRQMYDSSAFENVNGDQVVTWAPLFTVCYGGAVYLNDPQGTFYSIAADGTQTVLANNGNASFHDCIFEDNTASFNPVNVALNVPTSNNPQGFIFIYGDQGYGGAIFVKTNTQFVCPATFAAAICSGTKATQPKTSIFNAVFARNQANLGGSAVAVLRTFAATDIVSSTFCNNVVGGYAGFKNTYVSGEPEYEDMNKFLKPSGGAVLYAFDSLIYAFGCAELRNVGQPVDDVTSDPQNFGVNSSPQPLVLINSQFRGNVSVPQGDVKVSTDNNNAVPALAVATPSDSAIQKWIGNRASASSTTRNVPQILIQCTKFFGNYAVAGTYPKSSVIGQERVYVQNCPASAMTPRSACVVNYSAGRTVWKVNPESPVSPGPKDLFNLGVFGGGFTDLVCSPGCASNGEGNAGIREWCVPTRKLCY